MILVRFREPAFYRVGEQLIAVRPQDIREKFLVGDDDILDRYVEGVHFDRVDVAAEAEAEAARREEEAKIQAEQDRIRTEREAQDVADRKAAEEAVAKQKAEEQAAADKAAAAAAGAPSKSKGNK